MKIVINTNYGGFSVPDELRVQLGVSPWDEVSRTNPLVIEWAQTLTGTDIAIVEIPDNVHWEVMDYDGAEWIIWSESPLHTARAREF
jgi:hypothetical protein